MFDILLYIYIYVCDIDYLLKQSEDNPLGVKAALKRTRAKFRWGDVKNSR